MTRKTASTITAAANSSKRPAYHPKEYRPEENSEPLTSEKPRAASTTTSQTAVTLRRPFDAVAAAITKSRTVSGTTATIQSGVSVPPFTETGMRAPATIVTAVKSTRTATTPAAMRRTVSRLARHPRRAARPSAMTSTANTTCPKT